MYSKRQTRRGCEKNDKLAGAGTNGVDYIPSNKAHNFKILFNKIKERIGDYDGAIQHIGISNCVMDGLNKNKISAASARKILEAYNSLST